MASIAIATPSIIVNNLPTYFKPNTLKYTEGLGEQNMRTQSAGGGIVDVIYSDNAESKMSMVSFEIMNTAENIELLRGWKVGLNQNAISIVDNSSGFTRNFANMAVTNNYEVNLGADTSISVEFRGDPAV